MNRHATSTAAARVPRSIGAVKVSGQIANAIPKPAVEHLELLQILGRQSARVDRTQVLRDAMRLHALWQAREAIRHRPRNQNLRRRRAVLIANRLDKRILQQWHATLWCLEGPSTLLRVRFAAVRVARAQRRVGHHLDVMLLTKGDELRLRKVRVKLDLIDFRTILCVGELLE